MIVNYSRNTFIAQATDAQNVGDETTKFLEFFHFFNNKIPHLNHRDIAELSKLDRFCHKLKIIQNLRNAKQSTVNKSLDGSMYPS